VRSSEGVGAGEIRHLWPWYEGGSVRAFAIGSKEAGWLSTPGIPALRSARAIISFTMECFVWRPALLLRPCGMHDHNADTCMYRNHWTTQPHANRYSALTLSTSKSESLRPKLAVGKACSHELTPGAQQARRRARSESTELCKKDSTRTLNNCIESSQAFWWA